MTIAVTGATGFVGQAVLDEAARRGLAVQALTRREQTPRDGVRWVRGDLADHAALGELVRGCDCVMHVAGVVNAPDRAAFDAGNVAGTEAILDAAEGAQCRRFICVSSLAAREPGLSDYGGSKRAGEDRVKASEVEWAVVRPPAVYGPRDTEMLELFRAAQFRLVPLPPEGRLSMIHVADLARLLIELASAERSTCGQIYEPDDGRPGGWSHRELAQAIGAATGRSVWPLNLPAALIRGAAQIDRALRGNKAKLTPDRARYMVHPDWVSDPARAVPPAVWQAEISTIRGLAQTARWYRAADWL